MSNIRLWTFFQKLYSKSPVIIFDMLAIPASWGIAYWLRFNLVFPSRMTSTKAMIALLVLALIQILFYYGFKVYRGLWRFSSLNDVIRIMKSVITAILVALPILYLTSCLQEIPRSILPLYSMILMFILCMARLCCRYAWDHQHQYHAEKSIKRVLIIGAGQAGESLVRDLKRTQTYLPIGFIDDSVKKVGLEIHGVRVLGHLIQLVEIVVKYHIDLIFIAIPSASSSVMRRIVNYCEQTEIPFRTLPGLNVLASGSVEISALRKVNIEDLLGRAQVKIDREKIQQYIKNKRVVITGGGGSIGSELCCQIALLEPKALLIIDHSEFNLYRIEQTLKTKFHHIPLELSLTSVTDEQTINYVFKQFKPEIVFHAAAYKHVPLLEEQICSVVKNNVLGTQIVAQASLAVNVEKFILISTDKAVNPSNIMGTTKRVAEIYCQNLNTRVKTQFITVRFGNVLGSVGSVIPLFQKQLEQGGPLTVTHPEIQRYFMTISEASQLILQAMVNGLGGEIFVLDMGEPIKIRYLAEQMIRLAGKEIEKDISIEYIGLRPGEKLFEELFHESECLKQTQHEKLLKAQFRSVDWKDLTQTFRMIQVACCEHEHDELLILLKSLVPEFQPLLAKPNALNI